MGKHRHLSSPYGEADLLLETGSASITASAPLAADWTLGWWHAREAGDEAVFARSFWRAELGKDGKPSAARTEIDAFIGHWAFAADLPQETNRLPPAVQSRVQAYADGFNAGRRRHAGETPWTPEDCHLLVRTLGFLEWWETRAPLIEFLLQALEQGIGWEQIRDLWPEIGTEPDRSRWRGLEFPHPFSPEARGLVQRLRRFRPGILWTVPASRTARNRPLLGATYISDVTEPGLPFLGVRIEGPRGEVRGLSRPGHPGFLAGKTAALSWAASPAIEDTVDLRILDRNGDRSLTGVWAGTGKTGSLLALLLMEEAPGASQARELTAHLGSACLDWAAVDARGGLERWAQGPRWTRAAFRDTWLPSPWGTDLPVGPRRPPVGEGFPAPCAGRATAEMLEELLVQEHPLNWDEIMAPLRFLLPDTDEGRRLRRWTGSPAGGREAAALERLYAAVWESFWQTSPVAPEPDSPVVQALVPGLIRLLAVPHSSWFPSGEKNRRLAEAVRRAFAPGALPEPGLLGRSSPRSFWTEAAGGRRRLFASTVALVSDPVETSWRLFLTDDETEVPDFRRL